MKIKVKVISELLRQAAKKEGVSLDHAGMGLLSERINEELNEDLFNQKYLYYNIFKKIEKYHDQPEAMVGLNANYLHRLAQFLGFRDFFHFGKSQAETDSPIETPENAFPINQNEFGPVWYSSKKFGLFNIWRNPDHGSLTRTKGGFIFQGDRGEVTFDQVDLVQSLHMPGDDDEYWIEISYQANKISRKAYFASANNPVPYLNLGDIEPLYHFFNSIQSVDSN